MSTETGKPRRSETDESRTIPITANVLACQFYATLGNGQLTSRLVRKIDNEGEISRLVMMIREAINQSSLLIYEVESLIFNLSRAIAADTERQIANLSKWKNEQPWPWSGTPGQWLLKAGEVLLEFGDLSRPSTNPNDPNLVRLVERNNFAGKCHGLVIISLIDKTFIRLDDRSGQQRISEAEYFNLFFFGHPLLKPLIRWLSHAENQVGNSHDLEKIQGFLAIISRLMVTEGVELPKDAEFRNDLAKAIVIALNSGAESHMSCVDANLVKAEFIEAVPFLVEAIWGNLIYPELGTRADPEEYQALCEKVRHPDLTTTVEFLTGISPLPRHFSNVHFALLFQLWPKWRRLKALS